jgi:hypothetical protein
VSPNRMADICLIRERSRGAVVRSRAAGLTFDAGSLIAYKRSEERVREILAVAYARGLVPAIALAEVWRAMPEKHALHVYSRRARSRHWTSELHAIRFRRVR